MKGCQPVLVGALGTSPVFPCTHDNTFNAVDQTRAIIFNFPELVGRIGAWLYGISFWLHRGLIGTLEGSLKACGIDKKVGRRYAPIHRMDHSEIGEGGRSDRLSRQILVCACGVSFSIGAPLPGCAWLAELRWHADENSCKYRTGEVFLILRCKWSFCWTLGWKGDFLGNSNPFSNSKSRQDY